MDTFFAIPTSTQYTPLSPASTVLIEDIVTPIVPARSLITSAYSSIYANPLVVPRVVTGLGVTNVYTPTNAYYYDSGVGENPLARHETNKDLRFKFLDKWLYDDFPELLRMLKVNGSNVSVVSKSEVEKNDISKDSEDDLVKKSDFIGYEILTLHKNGKILDTICRKNNLKYYDLPHNEYFVRKAQGKYVKDKLAEMQK